MKKIMFFLAGVSMFFTFNACDLDPQIYSEYDREGFENSESALEPKLGDVYVNLQREYGYAYREGFWSLHGRAWYGEQQTSRSSHVHLYPCAGVRSQGNR